MPDTSDLSKTASSTFPGRTNDLIKEVEAIQPPPSYGEPDNTNTEGTRAQIESGTYIVTLSGHYQLFNPLKSSYRSLRTIRNQPTIYLAAEFAIAPIMAANERIEADDDVDSEAVKFIQTQWDSIKDFLKARVLLDCQMFGWSSYEKVFEYKDGYITIKDTKHLLPEITTILINVNTGEVAGIKQPVVGLAFAPSTGLPIELPPSRAMLFSWRPSGSQWFGESEIERVRGTYNDFMDANEGAKRYDRFIAGSHWIVHYPRGTSLASDGVTQVDNGQNAQTILNALESSGMVAIPQENIDSMNSVLNAKGWEIELASDSSPRQPAFIERLKYFDTLFARGMGVPEKAILEGSVGTQSMSTVHANLAIVIMECKHKWLINNVNLQLINELVLLNFGKEMVGKIRLVAAPMIDEKREWLQSVYTKLLDDPNTRMEVDRNQLMDALDLPKQDEIAGDTNGDGIISPEEIIAMTGTPVKSDPAFSNMVSNAGTEVPVGENMGVK
jgi:hypothetical protein